MIIQYLKKMQSTPDIGDETNVSMTDVEIQTVESEAGVQFPIVYKEFLFLGGKSANMIADMNHQVISWYDGEKYWKERQTYCRAGLAEEGITIDKPFWAFADLGSEQFHFFYLDEGDDPPVYWYCAYHVDKQGKEYAGIIPIGRTFSQHVIEEIKRRKRIGY